MKGDSRRRGFVWLLAALLVGGAAPAARAQFDLLVSSPNNDRVLHFDGATLAPKGTFVSAGSGGLTTPVGMAIGPDGNFYVANRGGCNSVLRYDGSTGAFIDTFGPCYPAMINGIAFGPDGNLYGAMSSNRVFRANGTTGALIDYIGAGSPLDYAAFVAWGPDGNLYVTSRNTHQVLRFDAVTGAYIGVFSTVAPPPPDPNGEPSGLAFRPDGYLYVGLRTGREILRYDAATGAYAGPFIPAADTHPDGPRGFGFGPDGNLYVPAYLGNKLMRYDGTSGAYIDGSSGCDLAGPASVLFVPAFAGNEASLPPVLATPSGPVQGCASAGVLRWRGIRYAEPPVGALRWRRPIRRAVSAATIDASGFGPACPQGTTTSSSGSEDCLSVSIWRSETPPATPLPVLVYIHGGGLYGGSASGTDGSDLAQRQNLVVVAIQYRLGALGFFGRPELAAEDPNGSTGNYGFLDQLEALRWVHDNIAAFGGDPTRVTIAGESAGGWSVCALMASPLSDGLFQRGIIQSGQCQNALPLTTTAGSSILSDPVVGTTIYDRSQAIATLVGCPAGAGQPACLRAASAASLVQALASQPPNSVGDQPVNPAIDGYVLSEQPVAMLRQGAADGRPLIVGSNANEMTIWTVGLESVIPIPVPYETAVRAKLGNTRADSLLPLYPTSSYVSPAETLRVLFEDASFVCRTLQIADAAAQGGSPAWVYHLSFAPTYPAGSPNAPLRTFHGLDLSFLFRTTPPYGILPDPALSDSIQEAWGSFARTGVPSTVPAWPVFAPATPGDLASVSVLQFDAPNFTTPGTLFRSGRCGALIPVGRLLDLDEDISVYDVDNCPSVANTSQANSDTDSLGDACDNCATVTNQDQADGGIGPVLFESTADGVGNACDNCVNVANPRVAADFLTTNAWATLTGGQRDDDHDGYGNKCDADFTPTGALVGSADLAQYRASSGKSRSSPTACGSPAGQSCARFDLDESGSLINSADLAVYRSLSGKAAGPKCPTCPLACTAGTAGGCN